MNTSTLQFHFISLKVVIKSAIKVTLAFVITLFASQNSQTTRPEHILAIMNEQIVAKLESGKCILVFRHRCDTVLVEPGGRRRVRLAET